MRAVVPIGRGRPPSLLHAVRALETHAGVTELWTVGETPKGLTPDRHINSPNDRPAAHWNVHQHFKAVLADITEPFVWTSDDIFPLAHWTPGVYVRKDTLAEHLRTYSNKGHYTRAVKASVDLVRLAGHDPEKVQTGAGHRPWLIDPDRARWAVGLVDGRGEGAWPMVYVAGLPGVVMAGNSKVHGNNLITPGADMASTMAQSWKGNAGRVIRETFREPSRWE